MSMTWPQARQLGKLIAAARLYHGLSIRDVEDQLAIPRTWLGSLEQGQKLRISPDRLTRIVELLDIDLSRVDEITKGAVLEELPEVRTYLRAKYALSPEQAAQVEQYVERLRKEAA